MAGWRGFAERDETREIFLLPGISDEMKCRKKELFSYGEREGILFCLLATSPKFGGFPPLRRLFRRLDRRGGRRKGGRKASFLLFLQHGWWGEREADTLAGRRSAGEKAETEGAHI